MVARLTNLSQLAVILEYLIIPEEYLLVNVREDKHVVTEGLTLRVVAGHAECLYKHLLHDAQVRFAPIIKVRAELEEGAGPPQTVATQLQLPHRVH